MFVALVTHPVPIAILHDLLVAPIWIGASRVAEHLRLDKSNDCRRGEEIDFIAHPQILIFGIANCLQLGEPGTGICSCGGRGGVCIEVGIATG